MTEMLRRITGGIFLKTGISTACLYPMETEKALELLLKEGFRHFEIFFNTISEIEPMFVKRLKNLLDTYHATVKSIHPFTSGYEPYLIFTDYTRRFRDTLDFYERYFETAAKLGARLLVIHGDRKTPETGISNQEYFEKFGELSLRAEQYGVTAVQENVNMFRSQHPAFLEEMRVYLGERAKFVFDIKQAVRSGNNPSAVCRAMGKGLVHIHMNDNTPVNDCVLPGKGAMDYSTVLRILREIGYRGDFIIEVYRKSFGGVSELKTAIKHINALLNTATCE